MSCDQNWADFDKDLHDYQILSEFLTQEREQRADNTFPSKIPETRSWTVVCRECENYRICSEFLRGAINPLLRTITYSSKDGISSLPAVKKGLQLIGKTPQFNPHSNDAELQERFCKIASDRARGIAQNLLNDFGHTTKVTSATPQIEPECSQSQPVDGTRILGEILWNIRDRVETAETSDTEDELDLDRELFSDSVTLIVVVSDGEDSEEEREVRVTDTSVRGILQSIHDVYAKYEDGHEEKDPMGDHVWFEGLRYIMKEDRWLVVLGS